MKKKNLFSLVAASALLMACSQEELIIPSGDKAGVDLSGRPELGQVTFGLGEAETRMDFQSSFNWTWENGDKVGAAIMDVPLPVGSTKIGYQYNGTNWSTGYTYSYAEYVNGVTKSWGTGRNYTFTQTKKTASSTADPNTAADMYNLVNYISSNYPYEIKDGKFTSQANLVEGHYLFYAPYDQKHLTREAIQVVLPMVQDCSDDVMKSTKYLRQDAEVSSTALQAFFKGTTPGFENAPVAVGFEFLGAPADRSQVIEPSVKMDDLFAYPMITIENKFNGYLFENAALSTSTAQTPTFKLDSVVIYDATAGSDTLSYKTSINSFTAKAKLAGGNNRAWKVNRYKNSYTRDIVNPAANDQANYFGSAADGTSRTKVAGAGVASDPTYVQKHIVCDLGGKELAQNEKYHFHAILPAANYGHNLYARVYVRIGDKRYVIEQATVTPITGPAGTTNLGKANFSGSLTDWNFRDVLNGDQEARLVRGEHYPAPELLEGGAGTKSFAGTMMTISLTGGITQGAFALAEKDQYYGFTDNADFINYMTTEVQRGVNMTEAVAVKTVARNLWKATAGAGAFAFAVPTECIVDAELVAALKDKMYQEASKGDKLTLLTNLPIAGDVKITAITSNVYTFKTLDGTNVTYDIDYSGVTAGITANALKAGINNVTGGSNAEIKVANGQSGAVVYLNSGTYVLKNCAGISAIYVQSGATLTVKTACSSLVVAESGATIILDTAGSLTNTNNDLKSGSNVTNNNMREIAGTVKSTVTAAFNGWPTVTIPANSKINKLSVDLTVATAGVMTIDQAQIDKIAALKDVNIELGANVTGIESSANVALNKVKKIKSLAGAAITWSRAAGTSTTITVTPASAIDSSITPDTGNGVTFAATSNE